jgi:DNA polymerase alpha-associated DNA helicase A
LSPLIGSTAVSKVTEFRIVIAIDPTRSELADFEFPERCRVLKLANSITYDREASFFNCTGP